VQLKRIISEPVLVQLLGYFMTSSETTIMVNGRRKIWSSDSRQLLLQEGEIDRTHLDFHLLLAVIRAVRLLLVSYDMGFNPSTQR
jgi:hypothetical protein